MPIDTGFDTGSELHQVIPVTFEHILDPGCSGDENIRLTGFDLLDGPDIEIRQFRKLLLGQVFFVTQSANVSPKGLQLLFDAYFHYGPSWRNLDFDSTAQQGVKCHHSEGP